MAQPNVAREPSMEEILASIRRIIESNDPTGEGATQHSAQPVHFDDEPIELDDEDFLSEVANDPGMAPQPVAEEPVRPRPQVVAATAAPERSLSLADVAARVRAASARQMEHAASRPAVIPPSFASVPLRDTIAPSFGSEPAAAPSPHAVNVGPAEDLAAVTPKLADLPPAEPVQSERHAAPAPSFASLPMEPVVPPQLSAFAERPAETVAPVRLEAEAPVAVEPAATAETLPAKIEIAAANLISEQAGAQVARSFNELAAVFDGLERRSVEDMAQEMLRPMLQEWLDDNLPTLVERLVREEIERVARGARR